MEINTVHNTASNLGSIARMNGKKCVPALDPEMRSLMENNPEIKDRATAWGKWIEGWTKTHLEYFDIEMKIKNND